MASGEPVPNGYYVPIEERIDRQYVNWVEGTTKGENGFGFSAYAKIYKKQVLRFKSGQEKTFFYVIRHEQKEELGITVRNYQISSSLLRIFEMLTENRIIGLWGKERNRIYRRKC